MINRFICAPHRQAMLTDLAMAERCSRIALETGLSYKSLGQHREALAHLGCAFESSEIVLSGEQAANLDILGLFNSASCALLQCLKILGYDEQAKQVLAMTLDRLKQEKQDTPLNPSVIDTLMITLQYFSTTTDTEALFRLADNHACEFKHPLTPVPISTNIH